MNPKTVYIADDDADILALVQMYLLKDGYEVQTFATGDELEKYFARRPADLVILDIMMPGSSGLQVCSRLRAASDVPIILLTAKETDADYVTGISVGADDYLTKPFRPMILAMRVKAILRRRDMEAGGEQNAYLRRADLCLEERTRTIRRLTESASGGTEIPLTSTEYDCLAFFINRFDQVVSREELLSEVWGYPPGAETRVADETIRRIRKKLRSAGAQAQIINKWGYGYRLTAMQEQNESETATEAGTEATAETEGKAGSGSSAEQTSASTPAQAAEKKWLS